MIFIMFYASTNSSRSPRALATASTLDNFVSRPYSISRTVLGLGMSGEFCHGIPSEPLCLSGRADRAATPPVAGRSRGGSRGGTLLIFR